MRIQLRHNPYIQLGQFELAIDGDGFRVFWRLSHWGWTRGAGFWGRSFSLRNTPAA